MRKQYRRINKLIMRISELIYNSAIGKKITTEKGKIIKYSFADGEHTGFCYMCAEHTEKGFLKKKVIKPTFADQQLCKSRDSDIVCEHCAFILSFTELRNYGIFASETEFKHPSMAEYKDIILNNTQFPFLLCIPSSGQKWIHIKSSINYNLDRIKVNLEEETIMFIRKDFSFLINEVETLYNSEFGLTKKEIESLNFNSSKVLKIGITEYNNIVERLGKYKDTPLMKLCCYLAQKKGEKNDL